MSQQSPVWLVTGASKGMGLEAVKAALKTGARVAATSRDKTRLDGQLHAPENRFLPLEMSFTDARDIERAVAHTVERFGQIDVLVNNAGYSLLGAVEEFSAQEVRANFDVNVFGLLAVTRAVLPTMRAQRSGQIINLASISANVTGTATGLYSATKAAVLMLSEALAQEVAPFGIGVTAVCPGGVRTDFLDPSSSRHPQREIDDYTNVREALASYGRLNHNQGGDPRRVAEVFVLLSRMENPPTRLYLGRDALGAIVAKAESVMSDASRLSEISESID
ncbi:SDR family oxidoreductase [Flexivirga caeni]|uniref:SDR family oxidoreductase n=1 Tax=Flexivirga caeni TaxID=2294115 RepID=A0A3M9MHZ1_9MICO|nr:SDR family oxidoreductase [Flexivirga caeni]RNI25146.1 SDR family oxidoreductase [Flexivirga caeni]